MQESLFSAFRRRCLSLPEKILIHEAGPQLRAITYGEALRHAEALRARLSLLPLPRGARVGLISENRFEWIVAYMAIVSLGAVAVPIDSRLNASDWSRCLNHAEADLVFLSDRLRHQAESLKAQAPVVKRVILLGKG